MKNKVCSFAGYVQDFNNTDDEKLKLVIKKQIRNLINNHSVVEFYVCAESNFDLLCIDCMEEIKREYTSVKLCLMLSEFSHDTELDKYLLNLFDEVVYLSIRKLSPQYTLFQKNDWLIEKSDFLIAYLNKNFSCSKKLIKYTDESGQLIVDNLNEQNLILFPIRLKLLRLKIGLSQAELATAVGVSPSTIGMYEQNRREPDFETAMKIALMLDGGNLSYIVGTDKAFKQRIRDIKEVLDEFTKYILENRGITLDGHVLDKGFKENFVIAFTTAFETTKSFIKNRIN